MSAISQKTLPRRPIRCLVVQLTRLGDTLQSLMALRAAKQLYPELEIHFLARERFAAAAQRVPWIKSVVTFPSDELLGPILSGKKNETEGLADLAKWISPLIGEPWDFVVNWSYSESSSYLTALIPARVKLGYSRQRDTSFSSSDGWSNYIQAIVQGGSQQNIHLTDILTTQILTALQIHIGEPAENGNAPVTSKTFFSLELDELDVLATDRSGNSAFPGISWGELSSRKWLGIQLGTSQDGKTWSPECWAGLASRILHTHSECNIVLLGGKEDRERERIFFETLNTEHPAKDFAKKRVLSLVGQTEFDLWASVVSRCHWIFAGDTAVIHLASVLGTRVMNISIGPVRWLETGPYGNGHYVVSANPSQTPSEISPEAVYGAWSYATSEWSHQRKHSLLQHFQELGLSKHVDSVQIHRSKIRGTQEGGGVQYESLIPRPFVLDDWAAMVMGHIARAWYCGWVPPVGQELSRPMVNPPLLKTLREMKESTSVLLKVCDEARRTALTLKLKSGYLRSEKIMRLGDREELKTLGKKLLELDALMERLGKTHAPLLAFTQMSKVLMHNLRGAQLSELGHESAEGYRLLGDGVKILRDWIVFTLALAKPMVVHTEQTLSKSPKETENHPV